jgi:hypothetical protein
LRLPRSLRLAARTVRRHPPLPEAQNEGEYERRRDVEALVQSLRRVQRPHVLILLLWSLFPFLVWVLAAAGGQEMSFWRGCFVWLLMGFALAFPAMGHRNQSLDWARRTFVARFPPGDPGHREALAQIESYQGSLVIRELVLRLRPPSQATELTTGPPVEQAVREALISFDGAPQGIPLPSDLAPAPAAPRRPAPPPSARSSQGLPLVLPGAMPEDPEPMRRGKP